MKRTTLFLCAILTSSLCFAAGFSKDSAQLNALASAWKSQDHSTIQKQTIYNHDDLTTMYAGQDLANETNVPV